METLHGRPGKERGTKRKVSAKVGAVGCSPLSNPLQPFQGFWNQNASPSLQAFHLIFSVQLCLPKTKDGHSSPWGASGTKAPLGRRSHDGRIEWHTVHSGSTDPHLHEVWESSQDGFLNLNLI